MKYDEFVKLNDFTIIDYDNPEQLMADDMKLFNRLYQDKRDENTDEETLKGQRRNILQNVLRKFKQPFDIANKKEPNLSTKQGLYRIEHFLEESYKFINWIVNNNNIINSSDDLAEKIIEYHYSDDSNYISTFYGNTEDKNIDKKYILPFVIEMIKSAGNVFKSEQEIYLNNKTLNIPSDSQLFFKNEKDKKSNLSELIDKYKLREKYSVYFVKHQDIQKYSSLASQQRTNKAQEKFNSERKELEIKKDAVVHELLYFFLGQSLKSFKEIIEKEIAEYSDSTLFYYDYDEERKEIDWYGIILVQLIVNKYIEIIQNNWKQFVSTKDVKDITIHSFYDFQNNSNRELIKYFEENKLELEKINDYHNVNGNWLSEYRIEYWLKKSVDDYQDMPEWIDYKELAKMYLEKMDAQMYRYYSEQEIPLFSKYNEGGSVLLAPNGKPSNLTPEQYELVRKPEFKAWFGDWENNPSEASKVIDENGEPLVVLHGTNNEVNIFKKSKNKSYANNVFGFFFTTEKWIANSYGENIKYCFLNLKNVITLNNTDFQIHLNYKTWDDNLKTLKEYKKDKIDGIYYKHNIYVAFEPNQIKLADGTNTTFDGSNPDIRFDNGGEADEPTNFWGTEAGGVLVYCPTTDRYLILLRSEWVLEPNTWGIISGKLDDDETNIEDAVLRESEEETGHKLGDLIPSFIFEKPNFKFHNFVSIIEKEFVPELNWENTDYKWVKLNEMPDNLHFGLKLLLQKEDMQTLVEKNKNNTMNKYNPKDEVTFNIPLLIRFAELMREDIKTDVALHEVIENLIDIKDKGTLTMRDYDSMVGNVTGTEENTNTDAVEEEKMAEGGKVNSIKYKKGDIKISLDENWYSDDTKVELVPVSELMKFREFDRKVKPKYNQDNSRDNINHLKFMFEKNGVQEPLIIEYSAQDNAVLVIEGNHRINSAIDLGMEYLPARVVLKKYSKFTPNQLKNSMKVEGIKANSSNYIPSDLKPSQIGITGAMPIYADGGIIEGRLHSECGDDGCGRKFQVGEDGHIIEAERDEAVIVANAFESNEELTIKGTLSEVASALNVVGGGKNFDKGATIIKNGSQLEIPELKKQANNTDVDDIIDPSSIIINRRSMADTKKYEVTGTPKQIASAINSINGNGVVIEDGAEIKEN